MADYIYLLQNRLTPAQWRALEAVREAARAHGMPVFLVGGAVRDLTSGSPVRDLDFAVQGEVSALVPDLETAGAVVTGRNDALSSVYLNFRGGVRAELSPTVTVTYPKPGQAEVQPAPILDDLRRRDFTANAMAVSLNEGSYGLLLDPLNGTADIENRELRLVSAYGFIEQPALLLRAARLRERLGWNLEERTETRYGNSKEENHIEALPAADRGYELEEIFHEEDPLSILEQMQAEGWGGVLFPALRVADADRTAMDSVRDYIGQLEGQGIHPDPSPIYFPLITAKLSDKDRTELKRLFTRPGFVQQIETIEARARELGAQLTSKAAAQPSDSWRLLKSAEPELVLWLAFQVRTGAVQSKIKAFLKDWPQQRQKIPYALMQEMRITPELPEYEKLLDDLFFALIDGKLDTPEAARAFLEPFSPPAPPQVSVRRRPAKSARGRGKRVVEEAPVEVDEDLAAEGSGADRDDEEEARADSETGDDHDEADDAEAVNAEEPEDAPVTPQPIVTAAKSPAAKKTPEPKPAAKATPPASAEAPKPVAAKAAAAPPKVAAKASAADARPAAKTPHKVTPPSKTPAKTTPAKVVAKAPAKAPARHAPAKAAKVPVKTSASAKHAAKASAKVTAKAAPAKGKSPAKTASSKAPAKKSPAKKIAAKTSAHRAVPAKAAKKAAAKGKKGR